ncbi:MAG: leucine--tRNA ligase [Bacteroidetes bacterium]|nr:leucine--tRNA ligase [Bacteroidota bacterium]MBS1758404.1 leucine--tRNA ligase [Bacteroidota bacterium]
MEYDFKKIEAKCQQQWEEKEIYKVSNLSDKPKYYVLDMFPYPSGAGLHVGHPLGYIASDIYSRYKRLKGFNVLHPMGFDSFGLPAEQYAIETGQHPATTTQHNIATFKAQLNKIGFCYDWSREVRTSNPSYYKWTQWIFLQLYESYFCNTQQKARPIADLIKKYETKGCSKFTAAEWNAFSKKEQEDILMKRRLAFSAYGEVNWCEALGTVLANDEVINGVSERGGHPVEKKKMRQWYLRITAYADRLLQGLDTVNFSDAMKEMQRNWIGKSEGAEMDFHIKDRQETIKVYTTRPDTIFGVDFLVLAPEHSLVSHITTHAQRQSIDEYLHYVKSRSDRERMAEVKQITGCFTGAYALNPFDGKQIPIWIAEYVLSGYGTGAIMAVPCGDQRDFSFARHFNITITNIIGSHYNGQEANATKDAVLENSGFLNGLIMKDAIAVAINKIEEMGIGRRKVNYRMRDAGFSRQRYWGEPFPIIWSDGIALPLDAKELPLELPFVEKYGPGPEGEGPLANIPEWTAKHLETSTMPGYAGSSWYFLRYMDPHNAETFCDRKASDYWNQVDVYIGGTEHAVGHLLYSRMWTKLLYDLNLIGFDEPFKKLVNQGMITGKSFFFQVDEKGSIISYQKENSSAAEFIRFKYGHQFVDANGILRKSVVDKNGLQLPKSIKWNKDEEGEYVVTKEEAEKMSKSKFNVDNPDDIVDKYGADTFRMYEMFLGPVEMSKPWDTKGIEGVHRFLRKLWRLFFDEIKGKLWNQDAASAEELKVLHKTIKKIDSDTENFSFNTAVSAFMIAVNELADLKCHKKEILENILILLAPFAPHIAEELWQQLANEGSILNATYPGYNEKYLIEATKEYPISINGKMRTTISMATDAAQPEVEKQVLQNEIVQKWLEGKQPKKIIFVKGKMVNVVI